jgi:transcriptional regulator with XRE-family HTH domain
MQPHTLIRSARTAAGLTQVQLARRLGISQAALARLERAGSNPTVATLDRVVRATGQRLALGIETPAPSIDPSLLREALQLSPAERIASAERLMRDAERIAAAGARKRRKAAA